MTNIGISGTFKASAISIAVSLALSTVAHANTNQRSNNTIFSSEFSTLEAGQDLTIDNKTSSETEYNSGDYNNINISNSNLSGGFSNSGTISGSITVDKSNISKITITSGTIGSINIKNGSTASISNSNGTISGDINIQDSTVTGFFNLGTINGSYTVTGGSFSDYFTNGDSGTGTMGDVTFSGVNANASTSGEIQNNGTMGHISVTGSNIATINNSEMSKADSITVSGKSTVDKLYNSGTLGSLKVEGSTITNGITLNKDEYGKTDIINNGVSISDDSKIGSITNESTVKGGIKIDSSTVGDISSTGTISSKNSDGSTNSAKYGIDINSSTVGSITNTGTLDSIGVTNSTTNQIVSESGLGSLTISGSTLTNKDTSSTSRGAIEIGGKTTSVDISSNSTINGNIYVGIYKLGNPNVSGSLESLNINDSTLNGSINIQAGSSITSIALDGVNKNGSKADVVNDIYNEGAIGSISIKNSNLNGSVKIVGTNGSADTISVENSSIKQIYASGDLIDKISLNNAKLTDGIKVWMNSEIKDLSITNGTTIVGVENYGTIHDIDLGADNAFQGTLLNQSRGSIDSIKANGASFEGNIDNQGTINGVIDLNNIKSSVDTFVFNNSGSINSKDKQKVAVNIGKSTYENFSFINSGNIYNDVTIGSANEKSIATNTKDANQQKNYNFSVENSKKITGSVTIYTAAFNGLANSDNRNFSFVNSTDGIINENNNEVGVSINNISYGSYDFTNEGTINNDVVIGGQSDIVEKASTSDYAHQISINNSGTITGNFILNASNSHINAINTGVLGTYSKQSDVGSTGNFIINGNSNDVFITNADNATVRSTIVGGSYNDFTIINKNAALAASTVDNPNITIEKGAVGNNFNFEQIVFDGDTALDNNNPKSSIIIKDMNLTEGKTLADADNTYTIKNVIVSQVDLTGFNLKKNIDFRNVIQVVNEAGDDAGSEGYVIPEHVQLDVIEQSLGLKGEYYTTGQNAGIYVVSVAPENNTGGIIMQSLGNILFHRSQYIDNIINNNSMQAAIHRYRDGNDWHVFANPYYTNSSSDLLGGGSTDYSSKGAIIGAHRGLGRGVFGVFAGYETTNADSNKILPISMDMNSIYGGIKYSGLITKFNKNSFLYGRTLAKLASTKIDAQRSAEINSYADIYNLSWTLSAGVGYAYINKNTKSIYILDAGPGYNGSKTKDFRMKGYTDEFYHANQFNMYTADISARWLQDWNPTIKTVVDIGYKHGFNTDISGYARIRGTQISASFDLPSSYYYGIASVVYHTKSFDAQVGYSTMFDKNSRDNSIFAQIGVSF